MKYIPAAVIGVLLAAVLSIQPGKAYDPTLEECEGDYRADWESPECQALVAIAAIEAKYGTDYYEHD